MTILLLCVVFLSWLSYLELKYCKYLCCGKWYFLADLGLLPINACNQIQT